jgi:hypothetical protein
MERIEESPLSQLIVTDSIPLSEEAAVAQDRHPLHRRADGEGHSQHPRGASVTSLFV